MDVLLLNLVKWLVGLAIPAALAMYVPRRRLVVTLVIWSLLPLAVLVALFIWEVLHNPSELTQPDALFIALLFYGGFVALPWFVTSALGSAIGLVLRQRPPAGTPATPTQAPPPPLPPLSQWHARHVGFERDGLILDGLDVWASKWRLLDIPPRQLPHPAHPHELHHFDVYEATGQGLHARQFAAGELSNGVWGFYTRIGLEPPQSGTSTDGTLGFENLLPGPEDRDRGAPTGRIWRIATGEALADGEAWMSSQVIPEPDGALLLALRHYNTDALFRLHPAKGTFTTVGECRPDETLDRLGQAVTDALQTCIDRAHRTLGLRLSPDGSIRVELAAAEWSNTHWVNAPRVIDVASGRIVLDLWNTDWDAVASFPIDRCVALTLRRYHAGGHCLVLLDLAKDAFAIFDNTPVTRGPIAAIVPAIEAAARRSGAEAPQVFPTRRRVGLRQLGVALAILVGALAAIGVISFVTVRFTPAPPAKLSTVPEMPH